MGKSGLLLLNPSLHNVAHDSHLQALMRTLLRSTRTYHQPLRKRERRRERMGSWRSRKCWCSTWKTPKPLPYRWKEQSLSSTPCCTGKQLQVKSSIDQSASLVQHFEYFHNWSILVLVVQEAVQFCVTVCEFSVANSVSGVRKMLPLVWSTDAAIKDAVVHAYRRLYLNPQGETLRSLKLTYSIHDEKRSCNI